MTRGAFLPDDASIADHVALWRRINPIWVIVDHNRGGRRLSSQAFQNYPNRDAFSVCISCDAEALGASPEDLIIGHSGYGVASFPTGLARQLEQAVVRAPLDSEIAHGHVVGKKPKSVMRAFAAQSFVLIDPEEPAK